VIWWFAAGLALGGLMVWGLSKLCEVDLDLMRDAAEMQTGDHELCHVVPAHTNGCMIHGRPHDARMAWDHE
jgi:hypothetical protein